MLEPPDDLVLLIVAAPSGAGKTTLCRRLSAQLSELRFSVSHTTRAPRPSEVDGRDYHFVDPSTFERMVERGEFAEHARVHGHLYGTSLGEIERARRERAWGLLFDIDYQGARQIKARLPLAVSAFILPPSFAELERRLRGRGTEDEQTTLRRLHNARLEIEHYGSFDYVIINDDVDVAYEELKSVVTAEWCKRSRRSGLCERMLAEGKAY
jgi:guanylate kinase